MFIIESKLHYYPYFVVFPPPDWTVKSFVNVNENNSGAVRLTLKRVSEANTASKHNHAKMDETAAAVIREDDADKNYPHNDDGACENNYHPSADNPSEGKYPPISGGIPNP